jgi:gametolysin peptidase M11
LNTPSGRVPLHFNSKPPTNLLTGTHVRAHGTVSQSGALLLASGGSVTNLSKTTPPPSGPLPNTFGAQSTLVILVNFQDAPTNQPYTVANAQSVVFGTVSSFFLENSYQQTWLTGNVVGWYTIPVSSTTCDISTIASDAQSAASAAGVNLSSYAHYVYAFPLNFACGFGGASTVGGSPSQSWINGTTGSGSLELSTVDHELGHAFGLWHSHLLDCGTSATIGSNCTVWDYGDIIDTMGASQDASPQYNSFQKERLGWLNYGTSPSITTVTAPGTYAIDAYELGAGPNALKILKSIDPVTGAKTWYYVEARQAVGFDAFLTDGTCGACWDQTVTNGVLVHIGTDGNGSSGDLLDMTPATPTYYFWFDPSLAVGQTFQDPAAGVSLTTNWVTSTQAAVSVQFSGGMTIATNQQSYLPGQTVSTTATATSGGSPVANVSVSFTITKANGNVVTGSGKTGRNGIAVYNLKLMNNDPAGTYVAGAAATITGNPHKATTDFTVQ